MDKALDALKYALKIAEAEEWNLGEGKIPDGKQQHVGLIAVLKMRAAIAELEARRPEVVAPDGWKLVPSIPNEAMYEVGEQLRQSGSDAQGIYINMVQNAAPQAAPVTWGDVKRLYEALDKACLMTGAWSNMTFVALPPHVKEQLSIALETVAPGGWVPGDDAALEADRALSTAMGKLDGIDAAADYCENVLAANHPSLAHAYRHAAINIRAFAGTKMAPATTVDGVKALEATPSPPRRKMRQQCIDRGGCPPETVCDTCQGIETVTKVPWRDEPQSGSR